jgi:microcystin-dependent protein
MAFFHAPIPERPIDVSHFDHNPFPHTDPQVPLETATYISDLVTSNPAASDPLSGADDHLRLLKATLKATFPNFTAATLNSTQAQLDAIAALLVGGVLRGNGAVPAGAIQDFGMPTAPAGWLVCDGQAVSRTTYADLFAAIGGTWGVGDGSTTFNVPNLIIRYRRHRDNSITSGFVGNMQGPCNLAHVHNVSYSGTTGFMDRSIDHLHTGTTGTESNGHDHDVPVPNNRNTPVQIAAGASAFFWTGNPGGTQVSGGNRQQHWHSFTTNGADRDLNHLHGLSFNVNTGGGSADSAGEARPWSATVLTCIKT